MTTRQNVRGRLVHEAAAQAATVPLSSRILVTAVAMLALAGCVEGISPEDALVHEPIDGATHPDMHISASDMHISADTKPSGPDMMLDDREVAVSSMTGVVLVSVALETPALAVCALVPATVTDICDLWVSVTFDGKNYDSSKHFDKVSPQWNQTILTASTASLLADSLEIKLWDDDSLGPVAFNQFICKVTHQVTAPQLAQGFFSANCLADIGGAKLATIHFKLNEI